MQDPRFSMADCRSDSEECKQPHNSEDTGIIHTSEIRFMDSSDSALSVPNTDNQESTGPDNMNQRFSVHRVQDFEGRNTVNSTDRVENYLRNYGALETRHFPAHSSNYPMTYDPWMLQPRQALMRSPSMATVSESSLGAQMSERRSGCTCRYVVMQAAVEAAPAKGPTPVNGLDKMTNSSLDHRMQKVLGTLQEDPRGQTGVLNEKPHLEHSRNLTKISTAQAILPLPSSPITSGACGLSEIPSQEFKGLSNCYRAFYNPYTEQHELENSDMQSVQPPPQLQPIPGSTKDEDKASNVISEPVPAYKLILLRSPLLCPQCDEYAFVSDFNKHMVLDHPNLTNIRISPGQHKNFFLDPHASCIGANRCHLLYLIRNKVTDLGSSEFKDYLPMIVMSTRVRLNDLYGIAEGAKDNGDGFLMIWLTGIVPDRKPLYATLTAYRHSEQQPIHQVSHTGEIYSIRNSQDAMDVFRSGHRMALSDLQLKLLTADGKDMLELQVLVN